MPNLEFTAEVDPQTFYAVVVELNPEVVEVDVQTFSATIDLNVDIPTL